MKNIPFLSPTALRSLKNEREQEGGGGRRKQERREVTGRGSREERRKDPDIVVSTASQVLN